MKCAVSFISGPLPCSPLLYEPPLSSRLSRLRFTVDADDIWAGTLTTDCLTGRLTDWRWDAKRSETRRWEWCYRNGTQIQAGGRKETWAIRKGSSLRKRAIIADIKRVKDHESRLGIVWRESKSWAAAKWQRGAQNKSGTVEGRVSAVEHLL